MRYHRDDVVRRALEVLDTWGLADLSMRRLAGELGVQPSALYHHVADKQTLLGLVADEVLARGRRHDTLGGAGEWDEQVAARCRALRDAVLAFRDGAELVATARSFGLGALGPERELTALLTGAALPDDLARTASRTLVHFVLGHAGDEQTHLQADSAGALGGTTHDGGPHEVSDFEPGLAIVLDGIRAHVAGTVATPARPAAGPGRAGGGGRGPS